MLYLKRLQSKIYGPDVVAWALQIQRLEGSRWRELWDLYLNGPALVRLKVAVALGMVFGFGR